MKRNRIWYMVKKEFIQIVRNKRMLPLILAVPVVQTVMFGYVVSTDVKNLPIVVCDQDISQTSRYFIGKFGNNEYFNIKYHVGSMAEIRRLLDRGEAKIGLFIPPGFAGRVDTGRTAEFQVVVDGSDNNAATTAMNYIAKIVAAESSRALARRFKAAPGMPSLPVIEPRVRVWYNPDLKSVNYMIPGLIGMILILMTMMITAAAIVRERERGTLEQLLVTPIKRYEFVLGKIIPYIILGFIEAMLIITFGTLWFKVPLRGSVALLFALATLFISTNLGAGLLISTVSKTQSQAMATAFFLLLPSMMLSGFMFPVENMPGWIKPISQSIPLTWFLVIVRGIFLKGVGLGVLWPSAAVLALMGAVMLTLSIIRFQKKLAD